jgi:hypothetical protein
MEMKFSKFLFFSWIMILTVLACGLGDDLSTPLPANLTAESWTLPPTMMPRQPRTPTSVALLPTLIGMTAFPVWVTDFSNPIIAAVEGQRPAWEDDFPAICVDEQKEMKVCSTPEQRTYYQANESDRTSISELPLATARPTLDLQPDLQNGYTLLNKGWFYVLSDNPQKLFYANIDNGVLVLSLPNGKANKDFWVYNQHFSQRNFVLQFDLQFDETQPEDTFRFQFEQGRDESFALDLTKNKTWAFHWGSRDAWQSRTGISEQLSFQPIRVLMIARDNQCAVYLNNVPLDYFENCRTDTDVQTSPQSAAFHILAEPGHAAMMTLDNIKMWDLDKITIPVP